MPSAGFEPATPTTKRPQTHGLDRAATVIGKTAIRIANRRGRDLNPEPPEYEAGELTSRLRRSVNTELLAVKTTGTDRYRSALKG
jgi:hypothetical protein